MIKVAVIGGGPAGMIASAYARDGGADVTIFEKNEKLGKKLYLTGKGRCNITNSADTEDFFKAIHRNPKFLYSALYTFTNHDIIDIMEKNGVPVKEERGGRIFPVSDKSSDCIRALTRYINSKGVKVVTECAVKSVKKENDVFLLTFDGGKTETFDRVVICTGGASYRSTGSTGDGYAFAKAFGHTIKEPRPSLIPLVTEEKWCGDLMGLSLKNVTLTAYRGNKKIYSDMGEMMFTHFGVTGPLVLTLSGIIADSPEGVKLFIDMKPALSKEQLDKRLQSDFVKHSRKHYKNSLSDLLPSRMIDVVVNLSGINPEKIIDDVTREERMAICDLLKAIPLSVKETRPLDEAIITRGGVDVKEIDPSTMQSKRVSGLFFAGEVIDVDAQTGGYNLQIAYSTGALAGMCCSENA